MKLRRPGSPSVDTQSWVNSVSQSIVVVDFLAPDMPIVFVNRTFTELTGYSESEVIGRNCRFLQGPETDPNTIERMRAAIACASPVHEEILNYTKDGRPFWNELIINPIRDASGEVTHLIARQQDISARRATEERARQTRHYLEGLVASLPGFLFHLVRRNDEAVDVTIISAWLTDALGLAEGEEIDRSLFTELLHPGDATSLRQAVNDAGRSMTPLRVDFRLVPPGGSERWFRAMATPRKVDPDFIIWDGLALDVHAEKTHEVQLAFLAGYDPLTGLCNRVQFNDALMKVLDEPAQSKQGLSLLYVGLEDFPSLNDALGHQLGDALLRRVGIRLKEAAEEFGGTAARLGEDEFGLLLPRVGSRRKASDIATLMSRIMTFPNLANGQVMSVQPCIGAVLSSALDMGIFPAEQRPAELLKRAHLALTMARQEGAGACRFYSPEFDDRVRHRVALRQSLQRAIVEEHFELHYQPFVDLETGGIVGAEALIRWKHPELGMQRPDVFIPYAESSGLIVPLGNWVMKQAMRQVVTWAGLGFDVPRISINLSGVQLSRPGFVAAVRQALRETGADPSRFGFELTEGVFLESTAEIRAQLDTLRSMGFELALDDFGTGHATFKYLRDFPVQKVKIDQTFIRQLVVDSSDASIVRAIIAVCRKIGQTVVAEGIETNMQRDFLREEGCEIGQGYLFSLPLAAEDFGWLLGSKPKLPIGPLVGAMAGEGARV
jgi:diguanylate cyclase (GGDEF)-like protein/PAS domain S-box-containing protein